MNLQDNQTIQKTSCAYIARAPVRVDVAGGGSDCEPFILNYDGAVVNFGITSYAYAHLQVHPEDRRIHIISDDLDQVVQVDHLDELEINGTLDLLKGMVLRLAPEFGLTLRVRCDVKPGTGLGSSGAVTVALVKALATSLGQSADASGVAEIACEIDIGRLEQPVGKQDQYAAAFGGINFIEFGDDSVQVKPVELPLPLMLALERRVLLFFTGTARRSSAILSEQRARISGNDDETLAALHEIKALAYQAQELLQAGKLDEFGRLLHQAWEAKKRASQGVTNPEIDRLYEIARSAGALGGKIAGAGGGGFLTVFAEEGRQQEITSRLEGEGLFSMSFGFESRGATVLLNALATA